MSKHCEDCGCRLSDGYCTNCQEEAYIAFVQAPDQDFSKEFMGKAWEQIIGLPYQKNQGKQS